jgi:hypothetical protein
LIDLISTIKPRRMKSVVFFAVLASSADFSLFAHNGKASSALYSEQPNAPDQIGRSFLGGANNRGLTKSSVSRSSSKPSTSRQVQVVRQDTTLPVPLPPSSLSLLILISLYCFLEHTVHIQHQGRAVGAFPTDSRRKSRRESAFPVDSRRESRNDRCNTNLKPVSHKNYSNVQREYARRNEKGLSGQDVMVQGDSLKTWIFNSPIVDRVQVEVRTEGCPFEASVDLWQGPDNTPQKMRVYSENGEMRPFQVFVETPLAPNTIAIRNVGQMEFPMIAAVAADSITTQPSMADDMRTIQGGALHTFPFDPSLESIQVLLEIDGRPLSARIELLQGPNNNKQVIELYCEDGMDRPLLHC